MENRLNEIFSNVNSWLKYAEAKNGILLSLNGAVLFGAVSYLADAPTNVVYSLVWAIIPLFIVAIIVLLVSFLPKTNIFFKKDNREPSRDNLNLIFYGDIRKLSSVSYLKYLYESTTGNNQDVLPEFELDIAQQIVNNAEIAYRKFQFFKVGFIIDFIGIIAGIVIFIVVDMFPTICQ